MDGGRRDHHATIFVPPEVAIPIEAARRAWDPDMAAQIAAHVTVAYPREAPDAALLVERARVAAAAVGPFRLRLGALACFGRPEDGVHLAVDDVDGGVRALRERMLRPPFQASAGAPHVTLVHPRTSRRGRAFWDGGSYDPRTDQFTARELAVTALDGGRWITVAAFALRRDRPRVERLLEPPADCLGTLIAESEAHGLRFVRRLVDEWTSGTNRFDRPGEALVVARIAGDAVGVCGLNVDPYAAAPGIARVRHLYVLAAYRRSGVGRDLVTAVVQAARGRFARLRLRTSNPDAARLYERLGFQPTADVPDCTHVMDLRR
jgi:GNAT superfamily N-acetyltransferase